MELEELILLLVIVNSIALVFIFVVVGRWGILMGKRIDDISDCLGHISCQSTTMFLNHMNDIKRRMIEQEAYEDVAIVDKLIEEEMKRIEAIIKNGSKQN